MRLLLLSTFNLMLLQASLGQVDTTKVELNRQDTVGVVMQEDEPIAADTTPKVKPRFIQPAFHFDYGKIATTLLGVDEKYEVGASLLILEQYLLVGEFGNAVLEPETAFRNGTYTSEGLYYRFGGGYMKQINLTSKLGIGALYGLSKFSDRGAVFISSSTGVQDDFVNTFDRQGLEARWLEVFLTSESWFRLNKKNADAPINKRFALGFYIRFRFLTSYDSFELFDVYKIPGYGLTVNDPQAALNLFVKFYPF